MTYFKIMFCPSAVKSEFVMNYWIIRARIRLRIYANSYMTLEFITDLLLDLLYYNSAKRLLRD